VRSLVERFDLSTYADRMDELGGPREARTAGPRLEPSTLRRRAVGFSLDLAVTFALLMASEIVVLTRDTPSLLSTGATLFRYLAAVLLVQVVVPLLSNGQTLGQRVMDLRVVTIRGEAPGALRTVLRGCLKSLMHCVMLGSGASLDAYLSTNQLLQNRGLDVLAGSAEWRTEGVLNRGTRLRLTHDALSETLCVRASSMRSSSSPID
jgi:uncharacterized RDD family membrane protein YckC